MVHGGRDVVDVVFVAVDVVLCCASARSRSSADSYYHTTYLASWGLWRAKTNPERYLTNFGIKI